MAEGATGFDVVAYLRARGVDDETIDAASAVGPEELRRFAVHVAFLGAAPTESPAQVWSQVGVAPERARSLWRAMGFAQLPDDAVALGAADVDALVRLQGHLAADAVPDESVERYTRLLGQSMGRVADALDPLLDVDDDQFPDLEHLDDVERLVLVSELVAPLIEESMVYILRRHLVRIAERRLAGGDDADAPCTVGFADVVSFTRLSGQLPEEDLGDLLERFEDVTSSEIVEHGGSVVKLIGDAVMFRFDDPVDASRCSLHLVESFGGDHPDLRVGLAHGPVIDRLGDVFGPTVNLASRLVSYARPGSVLVDATVAKALATARDEGDDEPIFTRAMRPQNLKGIGLTSMHVLRRDRRTDPVPEFVHRRRERAIDAVERRVARRTQGGGGR